MLPSGLEKSVSIFPSRECLKLRRGEVLVSSMCVWVWRQHSAVGNSRGVSQGELDPASFLYVDKSSAGGRATSGTEGSGGAGWLAVVQDRSWWESVPLGRSASLCSTSVYIFLKKNTWLYRKARFFACHFQEHKCMNIKVYMTEVCHFELVIIQSS